MSDRRLVGMGVVPRGGDDMAASTTRTGPSPPPARSITAVPPSRSPHPWTLVCSLITRGCALLCASGGDRYLRWPDRCSTDEADGVTRPSDRGLDRRAGGLQPGMMMSLCLRGEKFTGRPALLNKGAGVCPLTPTCLSALSALPALPHLCLPWPPPRHCPAPVIPLL